MTTFYKIIFTLQTISIWFLFRKLGYFEGLSLRPKEIKKKIADEKSKKSHDEEIGN